MAAGSTVSPAADSKHHAQPGADFNLLQRRNLELGETGCLNAVLAGHIGTSCYTAQALWRLDQQMEAIL